MPVVTGAGQMLVRQVGPVFSPGEELFRVIPVAALGSEAVRGQRARGEEHMGVGIL
jgi:hypothetical protein